MTWIPSWLPRLPSLNFAVPSSVQGRFISFLLKKLFGHLFKPGQLDSSQVDAQIGSGYVQVNDLELDAEAVNAYLSDLSITLHDGTISSVVARIPWPNPLSATLGLTLTSLHLTFHVLASTHHQSQPVDPAESMASMAESFVHEELTPREEATLWQSLHSEQLKYDDEQSVPGSLDPFLTTTEDDVRHTDVEPAGIPIFATLVERLLAKFEFDAEDIMITIVHPGNINVTMSVAQIRYQTNAKRSDTSEGETRSLIIEGFTVAARPFLPTPPSSTHTPYDEIRQPVSPSSSTSSLDEETQFAMSQSLAFLPPRSPSASVASSIYESALSLRGLAESREGNATPDDHGKPYVVLDDWGPSETLLSFGSSPIQIQLLTPSPLQTDVPEAHDTQGPSPTLPSDDEIKLSITASVIACAIRPWQIRGFVNLADYFSSSSQTSHKELTPSRPLLFESAPATPTSKLLSSLHIRGVFILLLPELPRTSPTAEDAEPLLHYFESPVVPPRLHHGYVRIHLDTLSGSLSSSHNELDSNHKDFPSSEVITTVAMAAGDLAIFAFPYQTPGRDEISPFPLFFTDPHLNSQYPTTHHHPGETKPSDYPQLPTFEILDWMDERCQKYGTKLGFWRSRPQFNRATSLHEPSSSIRMRKQNLEHDDPPLPSLSHAIEISALSKRVVAHQKDKRYGTHTLELNVNIAPVQICVDLEKTLHGSLAFFKQVLHPKQETPDSMCDDEAGQCTPPCTPHGDDYLERDQTKGKFTHTQPPLLGSEAIVSQRISIHFPVIRLSIRSPSPSSRSNRTGVLVVNIHDLAINNAPENVRAKARFSTFHPTSPQSSPVDGQLQMRAEFGRIMIACSLVHEGTTSSFLSLGPLRYKDSTEAEANTSSIGSDKRLSPLLPCLKVTRSANIPSTSNASIVALSFDLPSLFVDISKSQLDALQYWADNTTQLIDSALNASSSSAKMGAEETGLIGSRFFAKSRSGSTSGLSSAVGEAKAETVVKLTITESFVRIRLPRTADNAVVVRPFDVTLSDLDALIEFEPEGEQKTVLTVGIMDIAVKNGQPSEGFQTLLCLTSPRSLSTSPRPLVKLRLISLVVPETTIKETRVKATVCGFTYDFYPDITWVTDLGLFAKSPPGTFESVIPSERTTVSVRILDGSIRLFAPNHLGALTAYIGELDFLTNVVGDSPEMSFQVVISELAFLAIDADMTHARDNINSLKGVGYWKAAGYALLAEIADMDLQYIESIVVPYGKQVHVKRIRLRVHSCADTLAAVTAFASDLASSFERVTEELSEQQPTVVSRDSANETTLSASVFDVAFKVPEIGPAPDMINDDLPTNLDYLDESFGTAAGLRELRDDDLDEFDVRETDASYLASDGFDTHMVSKIGGETIKVFQTEGITVVEEYFDTLPPDKSLGSQKDLSRSTLHVQVSNADLTLLLYDGYDWIKTRRTIEEEIKDMRKRLAKIRQLVASGQTQDPSLDEASSLLFNSVYIGLEQDVDGLEPQALLDAIDEELRDDIETISQSSWQSLKPSTSKPHSGMARIRGKRLTRSKAPSMEFRMSGLNAEIDQYRPDEPLVSRTLVVVKDLEILDHIKTSTWKKFLTDLRSDSRGNIRETESNMVRIEVSTVRPVPNHPSEEVRLRAKILPLRLYVDQDAVDFLKKFFSFKSPDVDIGATPPSQGDTYIQLAEIFPIDLKLDYKPRRVDYRALRDGRIIELMNFFHFDGAEMTLRHITLAGVTGWPRLFEMLNDLWTPDVKATQLVDVISGVAPIRSMVNVGSGVADLVLLPIAQYKKDGRIVRGVQKGATAFVKSTAIEAIKMGARLATGTQVILEQAEGVLGGQFDHTITAETLQMPAGDESTGGFYTDEEEESTDLISRYAQQPGDLKEGMQSAYESLQRHFSSAAQTILAVPMEVYERSGNEGPVRSVIRAVPIAVLKPMIGASEAVSKTLLGLHNALDPNVRHENDAKYKNR